MAFTKRVPEMISYSTNYTGNAGTATWVDEPANRFIGDGSSLFSAENVEEVTLLDLSTIEVSASGEGTYVHIYDPADDTWLPGLQTALKGSAIVHIKETYTDGSALVIGNVENGVSGGVRLPTTSILARLVRISAGGAEADEVYSLVPAA